MKRVRFTGIVVIWVAAIALVFGDTLAEAENLKGEFSFVVSETRLFAPSVVTYCSEFGTITFDGKGTATVVSTDRCIVAGEDPQEPTTRQSTFAYTVVPDGTVLITEVGEDPTHCRLTGSGKILLCDAYGRDESVLQWHAVAVMK